MSTAKRWYTLATALMVAAVLVDAGHHLTISVLLVIAAFFAATVGLGYTVEPHDHKDDNQ